MFLSLKKKKQEDSCQELKQGTADQSFLDDDSWEETSDDVVNAGCASHLTYKERYKRSQERIYFRVNSPSLD